MATEIRSAFLICSTPRSGSYLLGEALQSAGVGGKTVEYFDPAHEAEIRAMVHAEQMPYRPFLRQIVADGTSAAGVFSAKAHWFQLDSFAERLDREIGGGKDQAMREILSALPGLKCIWLRRRDRVRQAISYARAAQTNVWWKIAGATSQPIPSETFAFQSIADRLRNIDDSEAGWQSFFPRFGIAPMTVWYEEFIAAYTPTVHAVAAFLGYPASALRQLPQPRLQQQADATTDEWAERFLASMRECEPPSRQDRQV